MSLKSNSQSFWERFQTDLYCSPYSKYFNFKGTNEIHIGCDINYNFKGKTGIIIGNTHSLNYKNPFSDKSSQQYSVYAGIKFRFTNFDLNEQNHSELIYKSGFFSNYNELDYSSGIINLIEFRTTYYNKSFIGFGIKNYFLETGRTNWSIYSIFGISL